MADVADAGPKSPDDLHDKGPTSKGISPGMGRVEKEDKYLTLLIKYIPTEAITTHQLLAGFCDNETVMLVGVLSFLLLPSSILWYYFSTKDRGDDPSWSQVILTPFAFSVWMLVVQSPAVPVIFGRQLLTPKMGSIVLIFVAAIIPMLGRVIDGLAQRLTRPQRAL